MGKEDVGCISYILVSSLYSVLNFFLHIQAEFWESEWAISYNKRAEVSSLSKMMQRR